jgi:hypothetical protein
MQFGRMVSSRSRSTDYPVPPAQARSVEDVIHQVHAWNKRKLQFTPRQISLTMDVLEQKGWLN